ncbi:MAG: secretin N-terminal domain-containing protein [Pseudomonadota bacterium]
MATRLSTSRYLVSRLSFLSAAMSSMLLCSACVANPDFALDEARSAMLDDLLQANAADQKKDVERERAAIKALILRHGPTLDSMRLTVNLDQADLAMVMDEILQSDAFDYLSPSVAFNGRVSARFVDRPLPQAINLLLAETGIVARIDKGLLSFSYGGEIAAGTDADNQSEQAYTSREIALKHLEAVDVRTMIGELFDDDDDSDAEQLTVSSVTELNTVFLTGPANEVTRAASIVARADRPVPHVIISALVVKVNTSSVETLGVDFADVADGSFSISSIVPNTTGGNIVTTFEELAGNTAQLTATIKFLAAQNMAQVLSRPYVATRSTKPATIEIVDDQFVRVDTTTDDSSIIATDSITAGITMTITPIVMADSSVRLDLSIEDSRFSATAGDVLIAKERNAASTSMVIGSGKTIVIGGLNSRYRITEKSGLPWLRKIPLLNILAAEQDSVESQNEMVVYLTPYIWMPGMDLPRALQEQPVLEYPSLLSIEKFGRE